jgi:hypothetical protein
MQLFTLDNFRNLAFPDLKNIEINGKKIGDMATSSNANYELPLASLSVQNQFASREYASAENSVLSTGINRLWRNETILNDFVNQHVNYYRSRLDLRDRVYLMTLYLTDYLKVNQGPVYNPYPSLTIPNISGNDKLLVMGKTKAPMPNIEALVFKSGNIDDTYNNCYRLRPRHPRFGVMGPDLCTPRKNELLAIKTRVIEEHKKELFLFKITDELKVGSIEKCVYDKMIKSTNNNLITGLIKSFQGNAEFGITIKSKDSIIGANGTTSYKIGDTNFTITISTSQAKSRPTIEVARTILHEYIHADIYRKLYTKYNYTFINDFRLVYNSYKVNIYNKKPDPDHVTMAEFYLEKMAYALKSFHKNELKNDYNKFIEYYGSEPSSYFYKALAWRGLKEADTTAWDKLSKDEKEKIQLEDSKINLLTKGCD